MKQHIKTIFFDYGGTLDACGIAWKERFFELYRRHGVHLPFEQFTSAFYYADDSLVEQGLYSENLTETVRKQTGRVFERLGMGSSQLVDAIAEDFIEESIKNIDKNISSLERLARKFRLGIISNNYGNMESICKETGLYDVMEFIIDSRIVGYEKPDPKIFAAALQVAEALPEEAVMVGDNIKRDIAGAVSTGISPVLITPKKRIPNNLQCPFIHSIYELEGMMVL